MNILSLFDGMACGMLAMMEAGVKVDRYVAYEIDKYAVQTSSHNFPMIEHRGDVFHADFTEFEGFDWLVGGSPCTYWSIAQKNNRETEASGIGWELFSQYVRALREAKPMFFLYENNKSMSKAIRESITETFGFEPICINSALVSAQNRQRLYWVGKRNEDGTYSKVEIEQPEDRGILLRDVMECATDREKGRSVICSAGRTTHREYFQKHQGNMAFEPVGVTSYGKAHTLKAQYYKNGTANFVTNGGFLATGVSEPVGIGYRGRMDNGKWVKQYESNGTGKANAITTAQTDSMVAEPIYIGAVPENNGTYLNGKQPSQQYRVYDPDGKGVAVTTCAITNVPERVGCYPSPDGTIKNSQGMRIYSSNGKSVNITAQGGGMGAKTGLYAVPVHHGIGELTHVCDYDVTQQGTLRVAYTDESESQGYRVYSPEHKSVCLRYANGRGTELVADKIPGLAIPCEWDEDGKPIKAVSAADGKTYTVYEVKDGQITIKSKTYPIKLADGFYIIRKLTVRECMRLQTVPEWYEFPVSDSQSYKMLGNGWTVSVISHLILSVLQNNP